MWFMLISGWVNTPFPFINAMYVFSFKDVTSFCSESDCFLSRPLVNVSLVNTEGSSPAWGYVFSEFVRRPLRQSCVVKYQFELIHSPKRSSKFQFFWTWLYYPEGILSLSLASQSKAWACYMITTDSLSYYNVTWKSLWETGNSMHRGLRETVTQLGEDARGCKPVNLELLFEIACCPTRLICTSLLSQHAGHGVSLRPGCAFAKINQREPLHGY